MCRRGYESHLSHPAQQAKIGRKHMKPLVRSTGEFSEPAESAFAIQNARNPLARRIGKGVSYMGIALEKRGMTGYLRAIFPKSATCENSSTKAFRSLRLFARSSSSSAITFTSSKKASIGARRAARAFSALA